MDISGVEYARAFMEGQTEAVTALCHAGATPPSTRRELLLRLSSIENASDDHIDIKTAKISGQIAVLSPRGTHL